MSGMKIRKFWPFVLGVIAIASMHSCTKPVTATKVDTLTVTDSIRDTVGLAQIRFVSMFPQSVATEIVIYGADSKTVFAIAQNSCPNTYIPIRPDTSLTLYAYIPNLGGFKLLPIPKLGPSFNTFALFTFVDSAAGQYDTTLRPQYSVDSERFTPPPPGYCYIRLINSVADVPGPLFVDLDTVDSAVVFPHAQSQSTPPFQISEYALIPKGQHTIYLRVDNSNNPKQVVPFSTSQLFEDGQYYTILATGPSVGGSIIIDQE